MANVIFVEKPHAATLLEKITLKSTLILLLFIKRFAINTQIFFSITVGHLILYVFLPVVPCSLQGRAQVMNILNRLANGLKYRSANTGICLNCKTCNNLHILS